MRVINLKCANCGANLEITPDMDNFACGYCGATQMIERRGGTISLKLTDAISKVQVGTDKTAAELAIRRIKEEMNELEIKYSQLSSSSRRADSEIKSKFQRIWGFGSLLLIFVVIGAQSVVIAVFSLLLIGGLTYAVFHFRKLEELASDARFKSMRTVLDNEWAALSAQMEKNKTIIK